VAINDYAKIFSQGFVLNIYAVFITTGKALLSEEQAKIAKVILRKMMTPSTSCVGLS
jgi:hypothetical protein